MNNPKPEIKIAPCTKCKKSALLVDGLCRRCFKGSDDEFVRIARGLNK